LSHRVRPSACRREQQRINIAHGFLPDLPVLLLDEPTPAVDGANKAAVIDPIREKKKHGAAVLGIVHDDGVRTAIADRLIDVAPFSKVLTVTQSPRTRTAQTGAATSPILSNARLVLAGRGKIAVGKRTAPLQIEIAGGMPVIRSAWRAGRRVA
jgi:energy-coupling factor transporter ATP-binding protein EcfA2